MTEFTTIGRPTRFLDGEAKVKGLTRYVPDLNLPGMLHARFVTSPYAHARIVKIEAEQALNIPGVVAVLTAGDLPDMTPTSRHRLLLARERTLFVGQPVALVLATDEGVAQDGADLVLIDYEPLPAAVTMAEALAGDAPLVWPDGMPGESAEAAAHGAEVASQENGRTKPSNVVATPRFERGDIAVGFEEAEVVVEHSLTSAMVHQNYMEPQATVVQPDPLTGGMTVWTSTQAPFYVREQVAAALGIIESDVVVHAMPVGGGFGGKFLLYQPLVALAAQIVGRPVRLVLSRVEDLLAGNPAPAMRFQVRLGAKRDGALTALEGHIFLDSGCFPCSMTGLAGILFGSNYRVPHLSIQGAEVLSFKPSAGAYRAPTAPSAAFALETTLDELARQLDMDPLELRLKNAVRPGDPMAAGNPWPEMGMHEVLKALQDHPAWQQREDARAAGHGVGIAIGGWPGGTEPAAAACALNRDGTLHIQVGSVDLTGTTTGFALLAAEAFGIEPGQVRIITGDTSTAPYAGAAGGSKITYTVGPAIIQAAQEARTQTLAIAADILEADPADLEIVDGKVQVRGVPDRGIPLGEIASKTMQFGGGYAPVFSHGRYVETAHSPAFCAQLAEVEVDHESGQVTVHRLVVVQDVGRAINPPAAEGQMMGGATQGLGWALLEQLAYDDHGQLLSASWMDYAVPHITQGALKLETVLVQVPTVHGPFGARGVGEPPVIATAAAVANAIADATGVRLTELPMTPPRVLAALTGLSPDGASRPQSGDWERT
jgi:CO/xanthine dehydrogenase Mo-binding subunit